MSAEAGLPVSLVCSFLLVPARVSFAFIFVPLPGARAAPDAARVVLAVATTIALYPVWPAVTIAELQLSQLMQWVGSEAAFGLTIGVAVGLISEAFVMAAQMIGFQAGYSYASAVDPATQSDSTVLQMAAQLCAGLLFFVTGLHREVLRAVAHSLEAWPPGTFMITDSIGAAVRNLGGVMLSTAVRLALPVLALTMLVDVSLALLGRINSHLQLLTLAMPLKMLAALAMFAALLSVFPAVFERNASQTFAVLGRVLR
ncbi:MAG TPA: flagellar biosynthetic protein FliR [Bryobacteraceae bacterium]|nr:flagellar biosynthetic protein FliR [Bryobacteraceae bacterium]